MSVLNSYLDIASVIKERNINIAKLNNDKKEQDVVKTKERVRIHKLVVPYLDNLSKQLAEKKSKQFWMFPDRTRFNKFKQLTLQEMQSVIRLRTDHYKNRNVAKITVKFYHRDKFGSNYQQLGILLLVNVVIYPIDNHGVIDGNNNAYGLSFAWRAEDFKTAKFTFRLLEKIVQMITAREITGNHMEATLLSSMVNQIIKLKVDLNNVLNPLANA